MYVQAIRNSGHIEKSLFTRFCCPDVYNKFFPQKGEYDNNILHSLFPLLPLKEIINLYFFLVLPLCIYMHFSQ